MRRGKLRVKFAKVAAVFSIALTGFIALLSFTEIALYMFLWINFRRLIEPIKFFFTSVMRGIPLSLAIELTKIYKNEIVSKYSVRNMIKLLMAGTDLRKSLIKSRG